MKKQHLWAETRVKAIVCTILLLLGLSAGLPAGAQALPSSTATPPSGEWGKWSKMTPSSFKGTVADVRRQCLESVGENKLSDLTEQKCERLTELLNKGECSAVMVPDGIRFDIMNGRLNGQTRRAFWVEKSLNRDDRAMLCDLGDNLFAYWFTGEVGQSCNNVAFVRQEPPVAAVPVPVPIEPEPQGKNCRFVPDGVVVQSGVTVYVPEINSCGCFAPSVFISTQPQTQESSVWVCD